MSVAQFCWNRPLFITCFTIHFHIQFNSVGGEVVGFENKSPGLEYNTITGSLKEANLIPIRSEC